MAQDDEQGEFAWPAHDFDGREPAVDADSGPATTELPVHEVPKPGADQARNADQPTMWVAVPRHNESRSTDSQPTEPQRIRPQPAGSQRAEPRRIEPRGTEPRGTEPRHTEPSQRVRPPHTAAEPAAPARDEPAQPGPGEAATDRGTQPPRNHRRWPLVAAAVLVVVAVGIVLALPPVSNRLALPWAPNAPKAPPPEPAGISRTLHGPVTGPQHRPTPQGVAAVLAGAAANPALGTLTGSVIDPATGRTLWSKGTDKPRTPASTTKLLTTAAALLALEPDMRIPTTVVAGREPGTVIIVAKGDVTLSSLPKGEESIYPQAAHLDKLVAEVERATGGSVDEVALDLTAYAGKTTAPGWDPVDVPKYTAATVPAMLDGGRKDPRSNHSERVADPAGVLLHEFAGRLGADVAADSTVRAPQSARVLGRVHSAPLTTLVRRCLLLSDNVLADALARQVAMAKGLEPSFTGATKAIRQVLAGSGFDVSGLRLFDGSGLSDRNEVPAQLLARILSVAAAPAGGDPRTAELRPMLAGLPVAGGTGTLAERYDEKSTNAGRGWVRAKTGTLSEVNALAGMVLDSDGHVMVFTFLSSGTPAAEARPALDALAADLRTCGCAAGSGG